MRPIAASSPGTRLRPAVGADVLGVIADGGAAALVVSSDGSSVDGVHVIWANHSALDLLGLTADEVVGPSVAASDNLRLGDQPRWNAVVADRIAAAAAAGSDVPDDGSWIDASIDGPGRTPWPAQLRLRSVGDGRYVVWLRLISEIEQLAQSAQRESEHRFRALAEHAPVGIAVSDAGIRLGFVNAHFGSMTRVPQEQLMGVGWLRVIDADDMAILLAALDEVLAGTPAQVSVRLAQSDTDLGNPRWLEIRLAPVTTPRRSAGFIATIEDVTERRAWETQLSYLADHDALTGLANRRGLVDSLTQMLTSRRTRDRDAAVLFCDLDGFKQVNDTLGHEAGDRVLIEVGRRLAATARDHDLVARMSGDEFVILVREVTDRADAEAAARRQLEALRTPIAVAGTSIVISASIGVAMAHDHDSPALLLQAADRGMYAAKRAGREKRLTATPIALESDVDA